LLGFFVAEKMWAMVLKGISVIKNGNGKDQTKYEWDKHRQETHDGKLIGERVEKSMTKLCEASIAQTQVLENQTSEMEKQTEILARIRDNGGSK
jgi:hypothetical protein